MLRKNKECIILYDEKNWGHISTEALDLVKSLLEIDPDKRVKAGDALKHKWFLMDHNKSKDLSTLADKIRYYSSK